MGIHLRAPAAAGLFAFLACGAAAARADLIAYDGFAGTVPEAPVLGQNGGTGWAGNWAAGGFNAFNNTSYTVAPGSLGYPGLPASGNHATTGASSSFLQGVSRNLAAPLGVDGTTIYMSVLLRPEGTLGAGTANGFFGIYLNGFASNDDLPDLFIGKPGGGALGEYVVEDRGGSGQVSSGVAVRPKPSLLVLKAEFFAGADRFTLFVNPTAGGPEPSGGAVKTGLDLGVVTGVTLYSGGAYSADEIRIGTTFADVASGGGAAVPLPGVVWAGLALLGGVGARRSLRRRGVILSQ